MIIRFGCESPIYSLCARPFATVSVNIDVRNRTRDPRISNARNTDIRSLYYPWEEEGGLAMDNIQAHRSCTHTCTRLEAVLLFITVCASSPSASPSLPLPPPTKGRTRAAKSIMRRKIASTRVKTVTRVRMPYRGTARDLIR